MNRLLLCPPDYYTVRYEINPWMDRTRQVDLPLAFDQWAQLSRELAKLECHVNLVPAEPGWPDLVFTANAGLVMGRKVLLSNFRHAERAGERPVFERWFRENGFEVTRIPAGVAFEGEGDALWFGNTLICGHGFRTDLEAHASIASWCQAPTFSLDLVHPHYYHLDTCFCPLDGFSAMYYPAAFDEAGQEALRSFVPDLIEVPAEEAECFACNAIVLGQDVILPEGCPRTCERLQEREYRTHVVPMGEFIKSGGACKCLVLHLR